MNDGKQAETAFVEWWEARGHIERFRDKKDLTGLNKGARLADFPKPADFIVSSPDQPLHYAEVKSTVDGKGFSFGKIQPGQSKSALLAATKGDGRYIFYIFSYPLGQWFYMTCKHYKEILDDGRRGVKFEELPKWER